MLGKLQITPANSCQVLMGESILATCHFKEGTRHPDGVKSWNLRGRGGLHCAEQLLAVPTNAHGQARTNRSVGKVLPDTTSASFDLCSEGTLGNLISRL